MDDLVIGDDEWVLMALMREMMVQYRSAEVDNDER